MSTTTRTRKPLKALLPLALAGALLVPALPASAAPAAPPAASASTQSSLLRPGDTGPSVLALQERLSSLGYWLGAPDANYGDLTRQAVVAFQKVQGLERDGIAGPAVFAALDAPSAPGASSTTGHVMEVDLSTQVVKVVDDGRVSLVLNTATGAAATSTPPGTYSITREIDGMRNAPLGQLWRPKYFVGGVAFHGYPSVPSYPASHGCVRLSYPAMDMVWSTGLAPVGTSVLVY